MLYYTFIEPLYQRHYLGKRIYYRNNDLRKLSDEIGSFNSMFELEINNNLIKCIHELEL
jgi:hypothetical protein